MIYNITYETLIGKIKDRKEFLIGTVLYKNKLLDGTKPNTNPKTNPDTNTNPIPLFYAFFEDRPMIFKLYSFARFSHRSNMVLLPKELLQRLFGCESTAVFSGWSVGLQLSASIQIQGTSMFIAPHLQWSISAVLPQTAPLSLTVDQQ